MGRYYDDFAHSGMEEGDDILHYGVLGMKWGIRRYQPYSYTGGSGKEVGEAKKLAKLSAKSAKLDKKINKLEKKRTNRFAIATNARVRGRAGDKQQKLIKKKERIDQQLRDRIVDDEGFKKEHPQLEKERKKAIDAHMHFEDLFNDDRATNKQINDAYNRWVDIQNDYIDKLDKTAVEYLKKRTKR